MQTSKPGGVLTEGGNRQKPTSLTQKLSSIDNYSQKKNWFSPVESHCSKHTWWQAPRPAISMLLLGGFLLSLSGASFPFWIFSLYYGFLVYFYWFSVCEKCMCVTVCICMCFFCLFFGFSFFCLFYTFLVCLFLLCLILFYYCIDTYLCCSVIDKERVWICLDD